MRFLIGKGFSARTPYLKVWRFTLDRPPKKSALPMSDWISSGVCPIVLVVDGS